MNCREVQSLIFAERDGPLDNSQRASLNGHLAACDACRQVRDDFTIALSTWRSDNARIVVPDPEREWHAVRRRIRGGAPSAGSAPHSRRNIFAWLAVPVTAAAALALALFMSSQTPATIQSDAPAANLARVDSVEVPGNNATTMVFVDEKSGWLFVLASDTAPKQG